MVLISNLVVDAGCYGQAQPSSHKRHGQQTHKHKIVFKDLDTPPFKERFCRIPLPQLDEVRAHLKMMLDAGVIELSNSPWCNAVVLVRKKDGSLRFCIDFRRLNSLTVKDSPPCPTSARHWTVWLARPIILLLT